MTQLSAPVVLTTTTYTLSSAASQESTEINFGNNVVFRNDITHWWVTAAETDVESVSPDKDDKKVPGTKTFTITLPRNETTSSKEYDLLLHAGKTGVENDPSLDVRSFTVTQSARLANITTTVLGPYGVSAGAQSGVDLSNSLSLTFEGSASHWWITGAGGGSLPAGVTSVMPVSAQAKTTTTLSFTLPVCNLSNSPTGCEYVLEINVSTSSGDETSKY